MTMTTIQTYAISEAEALTEKTKDYITKAKGAETRKAYKLDWKDFDQWCVDRGLSSLPAKPSSIAAYLADLATRKKVSTIERRLVSIRQAHRMAGVPIDQKDICVTETLKGIKNTHGTPQTAKTPILTEDLRSMIKSLGCDLKASRDKALLLIGFTGALRRGEIVSLNVEDLTFTKNGIEILLKRSKTDQTGKGVVIPIPYGSNLDTCPVRTIKDWLESSKVESGALFRAINKHGQVSDKHMCSAAVALIIKRNDHIKNNKANYSGHSLRAGFCTQAAVNGVSDTQGMRHSRHKKFDTWRKYVRLATVWQDSAATKLGL